MQKLLDNIDKELCCIAEQGINNGNIENLFKLIDIKKDIVTINAMEDEAEMRYYDDNPYSYFESGSRYGRGNGMSNMTRRYRGRDNRFNERLERIMEGADAYQYGRDRYRDGGSGERMEEGLEELMYAVCTFVESISDFAETPEEKEIIRKHIQKIKTV